MTTNDQFRDVDAHGGRLLRRLPRRGLSTRPSSGHVFAAGRFPSDPGTSACEEFITKLGRNFQV
ncbi:MAG: type VII secretion protein EsxI, partial [Mycobacterium sp.]|nr:type VII secretion protein EsxI [Mycobacterium sp.]